MTLPCYLCTCNILINNRNQGYEACVTLAVLDHNAYLQRGHVTNAKGDKVYHCKCRKQTKK